ncbi:UNVERIFIED_CONTAM: hypothetical protein Slati_2514800 [Sesamum latifolium]|uniref:Retrotransposon gag domain-containing protein n=1 Tax=Sesamum latifolium TaxID=2727402 RepID=A0AAW2WFS4_9LAMI
MQILAEALPQGVRIPSLIQYDWTEQESLKDYVQRFSEAVLEVPYLNYEPLASILQQGLRRERFRESIAGKPSATLDDLLKRVAKYIRIEEAMRSKADISNKRKVRDGERKDPQREGLIEGQRHMPPHNFARYNPLKAPRSEILMVAEQQGFVKWPRKIKDNPKQLTSDKYCMFHKDQVHSTEDCYHLKNEIKKFIQRGYLKEICGKQTARACIHSSKT